MPWEGCEHERSECENDFAQGDVFDLGQIYLTEGSAKTGITPRSLECPEGVVLVSQTCDSLRSTIVQVAPLTILSSDMAKEAETGKRPRYLPVRVGGELRFADLSCIASVDCGCLCTSRLICHGALDFESQRLFRDLVARRFGRFPFPDDVVMWCRPLREKIAPKARKNGEQGQLLKQIRCIRIEDENNWENPSSYQLTLTFLTVPGALPIPEEGDDYRIPDIISAVLDCGTDSKERAEKIARFICRRDQFDGLSDAVVCMLWERLVDEWVSQCNTAYVDAHRISRVSGTAQVVSEDEYTFEQVRHSEQLDLDYLSRG